MVSANPVDSLSLRNAAMDDGNIEKIKDAVKNAGSLKVRSVSAHRRPNFLPLKAKLFS